MNANTLEERLITFSSNCINFCKDVEKSFAGTHLSKQLIRSSTSVALNYGEVRAAESVKDFLHKLKVCLKELRESFVNLKIIKKTFLTKNIKELDFLLIECNELIAIFVATIKTKSTK